MNAVERLKRDHAMLRAKLNVLETALKMGPEAWFVLREVCYTLSRQLRDHMRREEYLMAIFRRQLSPEVLTELNMEHQEEPQHLRTLNHIFISESGHSLEQVRPLLIEIIEGLRRHMTEEETEVFPLFEHFLGKEKLVVKPQNEGVLMHINEQMTPNHIIREYPQTKSVFDQLFISLAFEGWDCLDEIAWRHGIEPRDLIARIKQVIDRTIQQAPNENGACVAAC